jgi:hypothetical protein
MTLSSEEIQIIDYLKSWNGKSITMIEICRSAAGRQKYRESPDWAKGLMGRLVEAKLVEINERGHYSCPEDEQPARPKQAPLPRPSKTAVIVGDNYFPAASETAEPEPPRWVSPQIAAILKQSGKKYGGPVKG